MKKRGQSYCPWLQCTQPSSRAYHMHADQTPLGCMRKVRGRLLGNNVLLGSGWSRRIHNARRVWSEKYSGSCSGDVDQFYKWTMCNELCVVNHMHLSYDKECLVLRWTETAKCVSRNSIHPHLQKSLFGTAPLSVWPHLFRGSDHEKRRGEQLKWSLACSLYIGNYHDQFTQPGWAECFLCI